MGNRILVVDDEKEIRDFLFKALSTRGFQVELVETTEEALQKIDREDFDLVLTDLKMPKKDGLQLVSEIVQSKPEILTVLMTGYGTIDTALEAMKRGASDYLTKPFNLDELFVRLQNVLNERQRFIRLKDFASQLERTNQELKKIHEIKFEFISATSQELKTPLAAIGEAVQLILSGKTGEINETQAKFLSITEGNVSHLTNILNNLVDLSRIESGKIEMNFEELDLRAAIESVLSSLKSQAEKKSVQFTMDIPQELPSVYGDREKVEQILMNLFGNTIEYIPKRGEITVSINFYQEERNMVAVSVRGSRVGITKDQVDNIFGEKYHQAEGSPRYLISGAGLGFAITKGLVEAHHGKIWVENQIGKGSTSTFTLPISQGERRDIHFRFILDGEFKRAQENHCPLTLFLIQGWNEKGEMKDALLNHIEERVKECLNRKSDIVVRLKHEKLLAALGEADVKGARMISKRIEERILKHPLKGMDTLAKIKVGAATYPYDALSKGELFKKAKERLEG